MIISPIRLATPRPRFGMTRTQEEIQKSMQLRRQVFQTLEKEVIPSLEKLASRRDKDNGYHSGNVASAAIVNAYTTMARYMLPQDSYMM